MTDKLHEKISALMDHQLSTPEIDELAVRMAQEQSLRHCWARYHLIGDALRNNGRNSLPDSIKHDLASRVAKIIDAEAPLPISLATYRHTRTAAFFKPLVGMAIAASVAMVAIVSFNMTSGVNPTGQQLVMVPLQNNASMMSSQAMIARAPTPAPVITDPALANPRLAGYLEDHSRYSNTTLVQGQMLPYVRIVGHAPKQ